MKGNSVGGFTTPVSEIADMFEKARLENERLIEIADMFEKARLENEKLQQDAVTVQSRHNEQIENATAVQLVFGRQDRMETSEQHVADLPIQLETDAIQMLKTGKTAKTTGLRQVPQEATVRNIGRTG